MKNKILLFTILLLSITLFAYGQTEGFPSKATLNFPLEKAPQFPEGEEAMYKYINEKLIFPDSVLNKEIAGEITIQFTVDTAGYSKKFKLIKELDKDCDSLLLNVIRQIPKWIPATINNKPTEKSIDLSIPFYTPKIGSKIGEKIYRVADTMPQFPGGEIKMMEFLRENLKWPPEYAEMGIQGRVIIRFIITKDGKIASPTVIRKLAPLLDKEALRVVSIMPDWVPAKHNGENVNAYFTIPISFKLSH